MILKSLFLAYCLPSCLTLLGDAKYIGRSRIPTDSFMRNNESLNNKNFMSIRLRAASDGYDAIRSGSSAKTNVGSGRNVQLWRK